MTVAQIRGSVVENQVLLIMGDGIVTDDKISEILWKNTVENQRVGLSKASVKDEKTLEDSNEKMRVRISNWRVDPACHRRSKLQQTKRSVESTSCQKLWNGAPRSIAYHHADREEE